jgi:hypothetical protein
MTTLTRRCLEMEAESVRLASAHIEATSIRAPWGVFVRSTDSPSEETSATTALDVAIAIVAACGVVPHTLSPLCIGANLAKSAGVSLTVSSFSLRSSANWTSGAFPRIELLWLAVRGPWKETQEFYFIQHEMIALEHAAEIYATRRITPPQPDARGGFYSGHQRHPRDSK